jgi:hypothetical protein
MTDTRLLAELTLVEAALRYVPVVVSFIASTTDTFSRAPHRRRRSWHERSSAPHHRSLTHPPLIPRVHIAGCSRPRALTTRLR